MYRLPIPRQDLESGDLDAYSCALIDGPVLSDVVAVALVNGMNGPGPGWKLDWAKLDAVDSDGQSWGLSDAVLNRWLSCEPGCAPVAVLPLERPWLYLGNQDVAPDPEVTLLSAEGHGAR